MDTSALAIIAVIIVYGVIEYQRRETRHREVMVFLKRGEEPPVPEVKKPQAWRLLTSGGVALLLCLVVGVLVKLGLEGHSYARPYYVMALGFALLLVVVLMMFARDLRAYRTSRGG